MPGNTPLSLGIVSAARAGTTLFKKRERRKNREKKARENFFIGEVILAYRLSCIAVRGLVEFVGIGEGFATGRIGRTTATLHVIIDRVAV